MLLVLSTNDWEYNDISMKHHKERRPLREIQLQLASIGASRSQLKQREVLELPKILFENEVPKAFIIGFYDGGYGMMLATDLRLLFIDVLPFGRVKIDDIPYNMVASTTLQLGMLFGTVSVASRAKNYRFWWLNKDNASDFNDYIEVQMLKHQKENVQVK
mgnify:FL=1